MTPKDKAYEIADKMTCGESYRNVGGGWSGRFPSNRHYLRCAWIAVNEIIEALKDNAANSASWQYWEEVKQEIEKL